MAAGSGCRSAGGPTGAGFLFPTMDGELEASPWNGRSTLLCLQVDYTPPLGKVGKAIDDHLLHGIAMSTLGAFKDGLTMSLERLAAETAAVPPQSTLPAGPGLESILAGDPPVREIMTTRVFTLSPDETLLDAANLLTGHRISGAPVVEGLSVVGMLSETDIIRAMAARHGGDSNSLLGAIRHLSDPSADGPASHRSRSPR